MAESRCRYKSSVMDRLRIVGGDKQNKCRPIRRNKTYERCKTLTVGIYSVFETLYILI
jgi:hypothetical protein